MMRKGDVVICTAYEEYLTIGKTYDVLASVYGNWIQIIGDDGEEHMKLCQFFRLVSELPPGTTNKNLIDKPHLAYFDPYLEYEMGMGMKKGAEKHGWNNHRELSVEASQQILDSVKRHLNAYLRGEELDPELKINHLACVINNINFIYRLNRLFGYDEVLNAIYGDTI